MAYASAPNDGMPATVASDPAFGTSNVELNNNSFATPENNVILVPTYCYDCKVILTSSDAVKIHYHEGHNAPPSPLCGCSRYCAGLRFDFTKGGFDIAASTIDKGIPNPANQQSALTFEANDRDFANDGTAAALTVPTSINSFNAFARADGTTHYPVGDAHAFSSAQTSDHDLTTSGLHKAAAAYGNHNAPAATASQLALRTDPTVGPHANNYFQSLGTAANLAHLGSLQPPTQHAAHAQNSSVVPKPSIPQRFTSQSAFGVPPSASNNHTAFGFTNDTSAYDSQARMSMRADHPTSYNFDPHHTGNLLHAPGTLVNPGYVSSFQNQNTSGPQALGGHVNQHPLNIGQFGNLQHTTQQSAPSLSVPHTLQPLPGPQVAIQSVVPILGATYFAPRDDDGVKWNNLPPYMLKIEAGRFEQNGSQKRWVKPIPRDPGNLVRFGQVKISPATGLPLRNIPFLPDEIDEKVIRPWVLIYWQRRAVEEGIAWKLDDLVSRLKVTTRLTKTQIGNKRRMLSSRMQRFCQEYGLLSLFDKGVEKLPKRQGIDTIAELDPWQAACNTAGTPSANAVVYGVSNRFQRLYDGMLFFDGMAVEAGFGCGAEARKKIHDLLEKDSDEAKEVIAENFKDFCLRRGHPMVPTLEEYRRAVENANDSQYDAIMAGDENMVIALQFPTAGNIGPLPASLATTSAGATGEEGADADFMDNVEEETAAPFESNSVTLMENNFEMLQSPSDNPIDANEGLRSPAESGPDLTEGTSVGDFSESGSVSISPPPAYLSQSLAGATEEDVAYGHLLDNKDDADDAGVADEADDAMVLFGLQPTNRMFLQ